MGAGSPAPKRGDRISKERYSFSKLSTFHQCKYQYYLNYIERRKGIPNAFSQYGTFIHSLLEQHAKGDLAVYELLDAYQDEYEKNVTLPFPPNKYVDLAESYYGDGYEFLKNFDGLDDLDIQGIELRFVEPLDDFEYTGIIDLVYKDESGKMVVQDWKSKAKFANKKERAVYARQPFSYALHIKHKFNQDPDILRFFMFRKQNIVDIPFTEKGYEEAMGWIRSSVKEIRDCKEWSATPDLFFCSNLCNFRETCKHKG